MFAKELRRAMVIMLIGVGIALVSITARNTRDYGLYFFVPIYWLGIVYAGRKLIQVLGNCLKVLLTCEFISLLLRPFWGTILCVILFGIGLVGILCLGWIYGLYKCGNCLWESYKADRRQIPH